MHAMNDGTMFVEERKIKILEHVEERRKATVAELCDAFHVSSATIRNDLRDLERAGLLIRTHGGAMVKSKTGLEPDMNQRRVQNLDAKRRIAQAAVSLVEDGDTVVLDTGTTVLELARLLVGKRDVTVVTNDLAIALLLEDAETIRVIFMGGLVRRKFHCTVMYGPFGREMLSGLTVDKAFMGLNGFSLEKGATTPDLSHAETKKAMMAIAAKVVLLFDSEKMNRNSFAQFAPLDSIDAIVTESLKDADQKALEDVGIEVIVTGTD